MPAPNARLLHQIHQWVGPAEDAGEADAELLGRFLRQRDEAAFTTLVRRHGPMVLNLCRRLLGDAHATEDAFQATFLVLARQAHAIRRPTALAAWLYGTARRIALKARALAARTRTIADPCVPDSRLDPLSELSAREVLVILDEEVARLPEAYRLAVVLCNLDGKSHEEAAAVLGCTTGALHGRLDRGRRRLHDRLARRGLTLAAALAVTEVARAGVIGAGLPAAVTGKIVTAALAFASLSTARLAPAPAAAERLAREALRGAGLAKLKLSAGLLLMLGLAALGAGRLSESTPDAPVPLVAEAVSNTQVDKPPPRTDAHGDALPVGAMSRLGTVQQRAPGSRIAVTADGKEIVAVNADLVVRRFDAATGALRSVTTLPRERSHWPFWLSPRGTLLLTVVNAAPRAPQLELWDLTQGKVVRTLPLDKWSDPLGAAFSGDDQRIAFADSAFSLHRVLLWDWKDDKSRVVWSHKQEIREHYYDPVVALSSDGKRLVASHRDRKLRCWDADTCKFLWESPKEQWWPALFFRPGSRTLVTHSDGLTLWDADTGKATQVKKAPKDARYPFSASPDGRLLAFETGFDEMLLWEPDSHEPATRLPATGPRGSGHVVPHRMPDFAFMPDGKSVIRRAGALVRWNVADGKAAFVDTSTWGHTEAVTRLVFSPDGRHLASGADDRTARIWDVATARSLHWLPKGVSHHLAFMPDGRHLLTSPFGLGDVVLERWDVRTGQPAKGFELKDREEFMQSSGNREIRVTADGARVVVLTFKNGRRGDESVLTAWNPATGACLEHRRVPWPEDSVLLPDGERVLAADSHTGEVRVLSVASGKPLLSFTMDPQSNQRQHWTWDLALAPHGGLMAARACRLDFDTEKREYGPVHVGDLATGRQLAKIPTAGLVVIAFSADNRLLAIAEAARVRLWETASMREVGQVPVAAPDTPADRPVVRSMAISPDGRILATGHADSTIVFWDATFTGTGHGGLTLKQADTCWADLAGADAARGYAAIWQLANAPQQAIPLLRQGLRPVEALPQEQSRKLLADLDGDDFELRQSAAQKLQELGERAGPALQQALKAGPSLEARRRIEKLLESLNGWGPLEGDNLRALRGVQILEATATTEARAVLVTLAGGVPNARLTRDAQAALDRLRLKPAATP
jgi:RNA polymerase sigma factor (sigma-70 family)